MPKDRGEPPCETWENVRGNWEKHVGNWCLWEFPRHLVTSFQPASYIDGTTHKCRGIFIVFLALFSLRSDQKSQHKAR